MTDQEWQRFRVRFAVMFARMSKEKRRLVFCLLLRTAFSRDMSDADADALADDLRAVGIDPCLIDEARIDAAAAKLLDDVEI